jgi:hypothetical protein
MAAAGAQEQEAARAALLSAYGQRLGSESSYGMAEAQKQYEFKNAMEQMSHDTMKKGYGRSWQGYQAALDDWRARVGIGLKDNFKDYEDQQRQYAQAGEGMTTGSNFLTALLDKD